MAANQKSSFAQRGESLLSRMDEFFQRRLSLTSRVITLIAAIVLIPTLFAPLYHMTLFSNQFPDGLNLYINAGSLEGGHEEGRDDLKEINTLNHYIGMKALDAADFPEFVWIPLAIGAFIVLCFRAAVIGRMWTLVDTFMLFIWFGMFSAWTFYSRMYAYGHRLDPTAPVRVPPFMPPLFGSEKMANFEVYNFPGLGSYCLFVFLVLLVVGMWLTLRRHLPAT